MMNQINITDSFNLTNSTRKLTKEGYLQATAALTRVGVQKYDLSSITGLDSDRGKIVSVFRPPETVFNDETIESAKLKPITMNHPNEMVDSDNYNNYSVGNLGENVHRIDKDRLGATIQINDKSIVDDIMNGSISEISMGYRSDIIKKSGSYFDDKYSYTFNGPMHMNHCAIVDKGRCGDSVSILDKKEECSLMSEDMENKSKAVEDKAIADDVKESNQEAKDPSIKDESDKPIDAIKSAMLADKRFLAMLKEAMGSVSKSDVNDTEDSKAKAKDNVLSDHAEDEQDIKKAFTDEVSYRVNLIDKARGLVKDADLTELSNREILEKSLEKSKINVKEKSDDYLLGVLDSAIKDHVEAKEYFENSKSNTSHSPRYFNSIDIKKL